MTFPSPLTNEQRCNLFGRFAYRPDPAPGNAEKIFVTDDWATKNLVKVSLGPLAKLKQGVTHTWMHKLVEPKFLHLLEELEKASCLKDIITFDGCYAGRFMRGRPGKLSAHAWGSALDFNARYNPLGQPGAKKGDMGYMGRVAEVAELNGWACGIRFTRNDPMHVEVCKL